MSAIKLERNAWNSREKSRSGVHNRLLKAMALVYSTKGECVEELGWISEEHLRTKDKKPANEQEKKQEGKQSCQ